MLDIRPSLRLPATLALLAFALLGCGNDTGSNPGGSIDTTTRKDTVCKVNCGTKPKDTACKVNCAFTPGPAAVAPYHPLTAQQIQVAIDTFGAGTRKSFWGMKLVSSKGRSFLMGLPDSTRPEDTWAVPQHRVGFSYDFYIERTELTVSEFCRVMNWAVNEGFVHVVRRDGGRWLATTGHDSLILCTLVPENTGVSSRRVTTDGASVSPSDPFYNRSMDMVTYPGAKLYANFRSKMVGLEPVYDSLTFKPDFRKNGYRFPTEAEYEYALRAGTTTLYPWGLDEVLYELTRVWTRKYLDQSSVGLNQPNDWGLYDMIGGEDVWLEGHLTEPFQHPQATVVDPIAGNDTGKVSCYYGDSRSGGRKYCPQSTTNSLRLVLPLRQ